MAKPCKHCQSTQHSSAFCFKAPKKPVKRSPLRSSVKKVKVSTKKKPKARTRSYYVKELDKIFSVYIRLKNADKEGYCICVTSGRRIHWKEIQNGHFYSRKYYPTRWNEDNCHPQSMSDNVFLRGNYIEYTKYMIDRYGREYVDELGRLAKSGQKIPTSVIMQKIEEYKLKVAQMLDLT